MRDNQIIDRLEIRELIEKWVVYRDAADWDKFRTVWADDGRMMATWFQGSAEEFIKVSIEGFKRGIYILHFLGGSEIQIQGSRAIAQTKMTISQRGDVHGVECDIVCTGRFYDLVELTGSGWRVVLRQPIYERDRMTPLIPGQVFELNPEILKPYFEVLELSSHFSLLFSKTKLSSVVFNSISKSLFLNPVNKSERKTIIQL